MRLTKEVDGTTLRDHDGFVTVVDEVHKYQGWWVKVDDDTINPTDKAYLFPYGMDSISLEHLSVPLLASILDDDTLPLYVIVRGKEPETLIDDDIPEKAIEYKVKISKIEPRVPLKDIGTF